MFCALTRRKVKTERCKRAPIVFFRPPPRTVRKQLRLTDLLAGSFFFIFLSLLSRGKKKSNLFHSYNWCSADYCEGGATKGTCHLKTWDTSKPGEIWGCSGAGQLWKVRFLFFFLSFFSTLCREKGLRRRQEEGSSLSLSLLLQFPRFSAAVAAFRRPIPR